MGLSPLSESAIQLPVVYVNKLIEIAYFTGIVVLEQSTV